MQFNVTTPVEPPEPESYVVEINTYRGDADGDSQLLMGPFKAGKDDESLQSLLETLRRIKERFPHGRGGSSEFSYESNVLGFAQWFGVNPSSTVEELQECYPQLVEKFGLETNLAVSALVKDFYSEEWPYQEGYPDMIEESLDNYKVFYYNEIGDKFNVEIDWEE